MKRNLFVLACIVALTVVTASASNLLSNGSFQSGDFSNWVLGTTPDGTAGEGYPIVTTWPLGGQNAAKYEVGQIQSDGLFEGATLSQDFFTSGGMATLSFLWAAQGDGIHENADGGLFELILDGSVLASHDVGTIEPNDLLSGMLSASLNLTPGTHTFEIDILRPFLTLPGNTPYQYVTGASVDAATTPEPGTLLLLGAGLLGVLGTMRRRRK
ncbi:MAG TPA: PEP-CTERM sorting domain-containing protein [Terriglobales bacterium]|nr:PEP-CTERM sorting domain-containing protein [Terriglobales bacterium]